MFGLNNKNKLVKVPDLGTFIIENSLKQPNITGSRINWYMGSNKRGWTDGAIYPHPNAEYIPPTVDGTNWYEGTVGIRFDASRSAAVYAGNRNIPLCLAFNYVIKI